VCVDKIKKTMATAPTTTTPAPTQTTLKWVGKQAKGLKHACIIDGVRYVRSWALPPEQKKPRQRRHRPYIKRDRKDYMRKYRAKRSLELKRLREIVKNTSKVTSAGSSAASPDDTLHVANTEHAVVVTT
jgi:hypothetical protein